MNNQKNELKKIGIIAFEEIVIHFLKLIPILGSYLEVGVAIRNSVKAYIQSREYIKKSEIEAVSKLTPTEVEQVITSVFNTSTAIDLTKGFSQIDIANIAKQLSQVPNEINNILSEIVDLEKAKKDEIENQKNEKKSNERIYLEKKLPDQLKQRDYKGALYTIKDLLKFKPFSYTLWKARFFVNRRLVYGEKYYMFQWPFTFALYSLLILIIANLFHWIKCMWMNKKLGIENFLEGDFFIILILAICFSALGNYTVRKHIVLSILFGLLSIALLIIGYVDLLS